MGERQKIKDLKACFWVKKKNLIFHGVWGRYSLWPVRKQKAALDVWFIQVKEIQSMEIICNLSPSNRGNWRALETAEGFRDYSVIWIHQYPHSYQIQQVEIHHCNCNWSWAHTSSPNLLLNEDVFLQAQSACTQNCPSSVWEQVCINLNTSPSYIHCRKVKMSYPQVSGQPWAGMPQRFRAILGSRP